MQTSATRAYYETPRQPELEKTAFGLGGILTHLATNALAKGTHRYTNLAEELAQKGLQHGLTGRQALGGGRFASKMVMGPEFMAEYEAALQLGNKLRQGTELTERQIQKLRAQGLAGKNLDEAVQAARDAAARRRLGVANLALQTVLTRAKVRGGPEGVEALRGSPLLGSLISAIEHEQRGKQVGKKVHDTLLGTAAGKLLDFLPGNAARQITTWGTRKRLHEYGGLERTLQNLASGAAVGLPGAAAVAGAEALTGGHSALATAAGLGAHGGINALRNLAGQYAPVRNKMFRDQITEAMQNPNPSALRLAGEKALEWGVSPALFTGSNVGRAFSKANMPDEAELVMQILEGKNPVPQGRRVAWGMANDLTANAARDTAQGLRVLRGGVRTVNNGLQGLAAPTTPGSARKMPAAPPAPGAPLGGLLPAIGVTGAGVGTGLLAHQLLRSPGGSAELPGTSSMGPSAEQ